MTFIWHYGILTPNDTNNSIAEGGVRVTEATLQTYLYSLPAGEDVMLVTGHPAPDTDAVVSALFEAWRLTIGGIPAAPMVQGTMPRETAWLLGSLATAVPTVKEVDPTRRLVLTDHHDVDAYPNPVAMVVDHHPLTTAVNWRGADAVIFPVGAATTLVARRIRADGITPDPVCARILLGAILLDTEGLSHYKAKAEDLDIAAWLVSLCGEDPAALFAALRGQLLSETDLATLYRRDYRRYTAADGAPLLGWAILKVWADACPDLDGVRRLLAADPEPTRVAKIVLHHPDDSREEYYLAAGEEADTLLAVVQTSAGELAQRLAPDTVYLPSGCYHWGRKRYAARLTEMLGKKS